MNSPLADRIRPEDLCDVVGQAHILGKNKPLSKIIESGKIPNLIFYGPSGVGKTTVARIIAKKCGKKLFKINATTASTADLKDVFSSVNTLDSQNGILLYLDEIQYFNKKQQQTLLEHIENGNITLIASTTENPYFYVYNAILSRSTVFEFKELKPEDIKSAVLRAAKITEQEENNTVVFETEKVLNLISASCMGDVRKALNTFELAVICAERKNGTINITEQTVEQLVQKSALRYDRDGDEHYDILSAYQKSMRGSDPNAAVHYLARLLEAGDLISACRRLLVCACEDVGLANPQIIPIVKSAVDSALMLGLPEARIPLADAVVLVSISPKSNSGYLAIDEAINDIQNGNSGPIPRTLQNMHFDGEDNKNKGQFYKYPHSFPNRWVEQQYLPNELKDKQYYFPAENKTETQYNLYWEKIKNKK